MVDEVSGVTFGPVGRAGVVDGVEYGYAFEAITEGASTWMLVMTFSNLTFSGNAPHDLDPFYVLAPQRAEAQGYSPAFLHDHVSRIAPKGNGGTYSTKLQGYFVLCSGQGLTSTVV